MAQEKIGGANFIQALALVHHTNMRRRTEGDAFLKLALATQVRVVNMEGNTCQIKQLLGSAKVANKIYCQ